MRQNDTSDDFPPAFLLLLAMYVSTVLPSSMPKTGTATGESRSS